MPDSHQTINKKTDQSSVKIPQLLSFFLALRKKIVWFYIINSRSFVKKHGRWRKVKSKGCFDHLFDFLRKESNLPNSQRLEGKKWKKIRVETNLHTQASIARSSKAVLARAGNSWGRRKAEVCAGVRGGRKCVRPRSFRHYVSFPTCPVFSSTKHVPMWVLTSRLLGTHRDTNVDVARHLSMVLPDGF